MWSIYDTMILTSGIITAAIAIVPVANVKASTRLWSALIGGSLIVASLALGNLRSFRYPSFVFIGPVLALLALGVVIADARRRGRPGDPLQFDDRAHGTAPGQGAPEQTGLTSVDAAAPRPRVDGQAREPAPSELPAPGTTGEPGTSLDIAMDAARQAAWRELHDPGTPAGRLAELVGAYPEFGVAAVAHPNCYPELREWVTDYLSPAG